MAPKKKAPTKGIGFRVDLVLHEKFEALCKGQRSTVSVELRRYMEKSVEAGKLPQNDDDMIPADVLDKRIEAVTDSTESRLSSIESAIAAMSQQLLSLAGSKVSDDNVNGNLGALITTEVHEPGTRQSALKLDSLFTANGIDSVNDIEETGIESGFDMTRFVDPDPVEAIGNESVDSVNSADDNVNDIEETKVEPTFEDTVDNDNNVNAINNESVSCSNVVPKGTEPNQSSPSPATEATEAIGNGPEVEIAAVCESGEVVESEGAIEPKESTEVDIHPQEGKKGLPFPLGMSQSELAEYWGVEASAISQEKAKASFPRWSAGKDPEGLSWGWNGKKRKEGRYFVIGKP